MSLKPKKRHPFANIFPSMTASEYEGLVASIRDEGQLVPCMTVNNFLVDGVHREKACIELGIEPWYEEWTGRGNLLKKVLGLNIDRRQLDKGQLAMAAARAREHTEGGDKPSMDALQASFGTSKGMICHAEDVLANGAPEVLAKIDSGDVRLTDAIAIVDLPKEEQAAAVEKVASGKARSLREAAGRPRQNGRAKRRTTPKSGNAKKKEDRVPRDPLGNEITEARVRDVFADKQMSDTVAVLDKVIMDVQKGYQWNPYLNNDGVGRVEIADGLILARDAIKAAMPYAVCKGEGCDQKGCGLCRQQGWVTESMWREAEGLI